MKRQNKLRVLLVADYQDSAIMYNTTAPPLGLFRLRHHLQKHDIDCDVCDLGLIAEDLNSNNDINTDKDFGMFTALIDQFKIREFQNNERLSKPEYD